MTTTTMLANRRRAIPHARMRSAEGCPAMARMQTNTPTAPQASNRSACPSSATGEVHARQPNQPTTRVPNAIVKKSAGFLPRFQITGKAAMMATHRAASAGPQDQDRVCGPITTARTRERTRKRDEIVGMESGIIACQGRKLSAPPHFTSRLCQTTQREWYVRECSGPATTTSYLCI